MGLIVNFSDFENISATGLSTTDYVIGYRPGPNREIRSTIEEFFIYLQTLSSNNVYVAVSPNSAKWNSTYSTVNSLSDTWEESVYITPLQVASASWDSVYSTTNSNSAKWILDGGNTNGGNISIGTNDAYNLSFETNAIPRLLITADTLSGNSNKTSFGAGSATGDYSFAANSGKAFGDRSFAEGVNTTALGIGSHAEGNSTTASGSASHAEGFQSLASGDYSHAEGYTSIALGSYSHAEGDNTRAEGNFGSHAEGNSTEALGTASHAEGINTIAIGEVSHAEGFQSLASGDYSHAEGSSTTASGSASHAAGIKATAAQDYTYAWSDANLNTLTSNVSTTRTGQYMVSASGGIFLPGNVGIGTDNNSNALTVVGTISTNIHKTSQDWSSNWTTTNSNSGSWSSVYTTVNTGSAAFILASGNPRIGTGPTIIIGANEDQHLRFRAGGATNSEIRMTILSSGEVGINTNLDRTKAQQITPLANADFSNTTGMLFTAPDWYGGTIPSWTKPAEGTYDVYFTGGTYTANLFAGPTGPGSSSCRQSIGTLPQLTDIIVNFTNAFLFGTPSTSLSAAIYTSTFTVLASGSYNSVGNHILSANNVPAGTSVIVAFWGQSGLTNVSLSAYNDTIFTTLGSISSNSVLISSKIQVNDGVVILKNIPTSNTGLPQGAIWNNAGVLNIV